MRKVAEHAYMALLTAIPERFTRTKLFGSEERSSFDDLLNAEGKEIPARKRCRRQCDHDFSGECSIKAIRGDMNVSYCGSAISNLTVEMTSGKTYAPFGTGKGRKQFCLTVPENTEFIGFYGNADKTIVKSLGLICCEGGGEMLSQLMGGMDGGLFSGFNS